MTIKIPFFQALVLVGLFGGCNLGSPDQAKDESDDPAQSASTEEPTRFDGVWEVIGRTGNEDGSNEPVCGYETGLGNIIIDGAKISGQVTNKSGFEYTVEGKIYNTGEIKAMLLYQGYDAAELFGTFSAETNSAKGYWKDAVNACPGVWTASRIETKPATKDPSPDSANNQEPANETQTVPLKSTDS